MDYRIGTLSPKTTRRRLRLSSCPINLLKQPVVQDVIEVEFEE